MFRQWICSIALLIASTAALATGPVNINTASAEMLAELDGIGPAKAAAIVEYRQQNGDFPSVASLANVTGIGEATLDSNRDRLTVGNPE